ncbi:DUF1742-domain-containing protein [Hymenopellis radicata]|nr:DUF1742-domain-containing protein [Hymenopellis radicata]
MSFTNVYYKRTAATPKACYVCYKPTPIVLATINTVDFLYTCESHLKDRGFASQIQDEHAAPAASPEEIAKVKAEWEEKQKRKKEKEQEKAKGKDKDGDDKDNGDKEKSKSPAPVSPPAPSTPTATHQRYALHRDYYAMRQNEHRKRRQTAQAKDLAPQLPSAPRGSVI